MHLRIVALLSTCLLLGACGGAETGKPDGRATDSGTADSGGTGCADTVDLQLDADRAPVHATFVARGGGAYVDQNGDFHVVFGDRVFGLAEEPPADLVSVSMLIPIAGAAPKETTYTSRDDEVNLDVTRRDDAGAISTSFGLPGTGDEVALEVTSLGGGFLCAAVSAASNPAADTSLQLSGTIEVPYGAFEDLIGR